LLDTTFGIGGYSIFLPFSGEYLYGLASKSVLAQQFPTGKIIVASSVVSATGDVDFVVVRLLEDGSLDGEFGFFGTIVVPFNRNGSDNADNLWSLVVQPDGAILLAGSVAGDATTETDIG